MQKKCIDEVNLQSDQVLTQLVDAKLEDLLVAAVVDAAEVIAQLRAKLLEPVFAMSKEKNEIACIVMCMIKKY